MATTEHTINDALAAKLADTRSHWRNTGVVRSENIDVLKGAGKRPDILVTEPNVSPVVLETEVLPAATVETDAISRLGQTVIPSGRRILSAVAVRLPLSLRDLDGQSLAKELARMDDYEMALFTGQNPQTPSRWPGSGWVRGNVVDLSVLVQSASVPPEVIEEAANKLVDGVSEAAGILSDMATAHPGTMQRICEDLRQQD